MICIGIDPGKKGGVAVIAGGSVTVFSWDDGRFLLEMREVVESGAGAVCCLEHVHAMPKQGVTSMFSFGRSFGFIQGVLTALSIPYELVTPQKWKREYSITSDKNQAVSVARRLFPDVSLLASPKCRKPHDGMAEALLMAEYARRHFNRT